MPRFLWHVRVLSNTSCLHTCKQLQKRNLVIFLGVGAFEQLFDPGRRAFERKFSKNSNARRLPGGEDVEALI